MKKRVLSALLALCMACTLAGNVWAAEETEPTPAPSAGVEAQTVEPQTVEPTPSAEPTQAPAPSPDATAEPEATPEPSAAPDPTVEPDATPAPTEEPEATDAPAATATPDATADPTATPAPTEAPAATEAPAPSETPSATPAPTAEAEGEQVADGVEYAAALEQDGQALNVIVTAPEGAFDAGVTPALSVTAIEDEAEGDAIAAKLDESGVTYDGFAALDISFKNEAGEEIEPKLPVTVRIELPEAIVDSGIDLNTLAVQHLAEDEAGNVTAVEQVASVADGTIALSEEAVAAMEAAAQAAEETDEAAIAPMMLAAPANDAPTPDADTAEAPAVAEFEVSGFSTFTITWDNGADTSFIRQNYFTANVHYVDQNGDEINAQGENHRITYPELPQRTGDNTNKTYWVTDTREYQLAEYCDAKPDNSEATFVGIYYDQIDDSYKVSSVTAEIKGEHYYSKGFWGFGEGWYTRNINRTLTFKNVSGKTVATLNNSNAVDIYVVYNVPEVEEPDDPGQVTQNATVTTGKTAVLREDGNYDLTLSVSGDRGTTANPVKMDVLFIVDRSSSMTNSGSKRLANAKTAMNTLVDSLERNNNVDAQYSIVTFSGPSDTGDSHKKNDATVHMDWTEVSGYNVSNEINRITSSGGTDYQAGLDVGTDQLQDVRAGATKVVIFLSDGEPTWSYDYGRGTEALCRERHQGERNCTYQGWVDTLNQAKEISCNYFYAIGIGSSSKDYLDDLVSSVTATTKQRIEAESDGSNLTNLFKDIASKINFFAAKNVVMTDPLSQWADIVPTGENDQVEFTVTLEKRDAEGNYEAVGQPQTVISGRSVEFTTTTEDEDGHTSQTRFSMTPTWNSERETIQVAFDESYELAPGYRYCVSTIITPSEEAISEGEEAYDGKGENDTGTHANDVGFWSNENAEAKVTYTANSEPGSEPFPKPVIQVPEETTTTLTLQKTFDGLSDAEVSYLIFREDGFGFDVNYCVPEAREDTNTNKQTFMAPDTDVEGLYLPDGTEVSSLNNGGGGYRIVAGNYLTNKDISTYSNDGYTDPDTGASLIKNAEGNWVYSITLEVPICKNGYFFTVFEQHQEVPGYAKINDSNAEWTITAGESSISGTGKFVDFVDGEDGEPNVYESMTELGTDETYREQEDFAIAQGALRKLTIAEPTTIAFTNHYTGKLDVTKKIGENNENSNAETATYTFKIAPAHPDKLTVTGGLNGKTVHYTVDEGAEQTATLGDDSSFTVTLQKDQVLHFLDLPAIQWQVTENVDPVSSEHYQLNTSYTDENNNVVSTVTHWNGYNEGETIGVTSEQDGIASVDSAVRDNKTPAVTASAVAEVTVTNEYIRNTYELTVNKSVTGPMGDKTEKFTFTLKLTDTVNNGPYVFAAGEVPSKLTATQTSGEYTFELSDSESLTVKLPSGVQAVVTEDSDDAAGYEVKTRQYKSGGTEGNFTVNTTHSVEVDSTTEDYTVDFQNFRDVVTPTGLESNHTKPYALMVGAGALAGLALVGGILARRARRRREW